MKFRRYQHIERFGNDEVAGIEDGTCYVFPKIDGTNAIWDATGNREVIVTTSAAGVIDVPITITEGGDFVVRALNE